MTQKPHLLWLYLSDFFGWWLAEFLWSWPICWCHLMGSTTSINHFRGQKPLKKYSKYAHFCLKCSRSNSGRPCGAIKPYLPKNIVSEGTFLFSTHCRAIASTCSFLAFKKGIWLQILLYLSLYVVISTLASPCYLCFVYAKYISLGHNFGEKKCLGSVTPQGP